MERPRSAGTMGTGRRPVGEDGGRSGTELMVPSRRGGALRALLSARIEHRAIGRARIRRAGFSAAMRRSVGEDTISPRREIDSPARARIGAVRAERGRGPEGDISRGDRR